MAIKAEILLIEDDPDIAENIQEYLTNKSKGQWTLHIADNGRDGAELAAEEDYAVILLDVNLPGMDGFAVCRNLRKQGIQTPVIFLTARFAEEDALKGYESGGDDYLVKPFSLAQLFAKMSALLNRLNGGAQEEFTCGDLTVNRSERKIFLRGEALTLPPKEYDILLYFLEHPNRLIGKESGKSRGRECISAGGLGEERSEEDQCQGQDRKYDYPEYIGISQKLHAHPKAQRSVDAREDTNHQKDRQDISREGLDHVEPLGRHIVIGDHLVRNEVGKRIRVDNEPEHKEHHNGKASQSRCRHGYDDGESKHKGAEHLEIQCHHPVSKSHRDLRIQYQGEEGIDLLLLILDKEFEHGDKDGDQGQYRRYTHNDGMYRHKRYPCL